LFCILAAAAVVAAHAQTVPDASGREYSVIVGAEASLYQPDFRGYWFCDSTNTVCQPDASISPYPLFGGGAYLDFRDSRRVQVEAEARWLHENQYNPAQVTSGGINEENFLIGPRVFLAHRWRTTFSAKMLFGAGLMNLGLYPGHCNTTYCVESGHFTAVAFGGGADIRLTKRLYLRAIDAEYQYWPGWGPTALKPLGINAGLGFKVF